MRTLVSAQKMFHHSAHSRIENLMQNDFLSHTWSIPEYSSAWCQKSRDSGEIAIESTLPYPEVLHNNFNITWYFVEEKYQRKAHWRSADKPIGPTSLDFLARSEVKNLSLCGHGCAELTVVSGACIRPRTNYWKPCHGFLHSIYEEWLLGKVSILCSGFRI